MIKNDHFFRFNVGLMYSDPLLALMEKQGICGVGIFVALLVELRIREEYCASRASLSVLARRWQCTTQEVESVIDNYRLFERCRNAAGELCFSSPYLDEVMEAVRQQKQTQTAGGRRRASTAQRAANGRFTSDVQVAEQSISKQSKAATDAVGEESGVKRLPPIKGWESCIDEAFGEQSWMELQAMHSRLGKLLLEQSDVIALLFKQHIRTYGKESAIFSLSDAKSYFSNFIRLGSPTRQRLDAHLARQQCALRTTDPYRYEQLDPLTGERSYCGRLIPAQAPPRPNENAVWNEELQEWD